MPFPLKDTSKMFVERRVFQSREISFTRKFLRGKCKNKQIIFIPKFDVSCYQLIRIAKITISGSFLTLKHLLISICNVTVSDSNLANLSQQFLFTQETAFL